MLKIARNLSIYFVEIYEAVTEFGMEISRFQIQRLLADTEGRKRILESDENTSMVKKGKPLIIDFSRQIRVKP